MKLSVDIQKQLGAFHLEARFETENEPLALLGASGCGKSVTLRCIAGILTPDEGRITLDDTVLYDSAAKISLPPQQRNVGYLFQQYALFPNMTVRQNISVAVWDKSRRETVTKAFLERFQLREVAGLRPRQLSGGQQQRTALARILASEPKVILLDEPFSSLDSYLKYQLELELSGELSAFPGPLVWVTHDQGEAWRNCSQVCVMEHGKTEAVRPMSALFADPGTVSAARLSGCLNFAEAVPAGDAVQIPAWNAVLRCGLAVPPEITTLGVRSRQIRPAAADSENALDCTVTRVIEDAASLIVLLRPVSAVSGAPLLRMEVAKSRAADIPAPGKTMTVSIAPEDLLPLR